jgi:hypothetical protein
MAKTNMKKILILVSVFFLLYGCADNGRPVLTVAMGLAEEEWQVMR